MLRCFQDDLLHRLGDPRIPDDIIIQFGQALQVASRIHDLDLQRDIVMGYSGTGRLTFIPESGLTELGQRDSEETHARAPERGFKSLKVHQHSGTTLEGSRLPRERFSFWSLAALFSACSGIRASELYVSHMSTILGDQPFSAHEASRRRVAALFLPALLRRCQSTLTQCVSDRRLRGNIPFPRWEGLLVRLTYYLLLM